MRVSLVPLLAGIAFGCATTAQPVNVTTVPPPQGELESLRGRSEAQARRITELEARLGLLEAEAREMRTLVQERETTRPDVIRIGANREATPTPIAPEESTPFAEVASAPSRSRERRPLLRSIAEPEVPSRAPIALPVAPVGVPDRLPVVPLPSGAVVAPMPSSVVPAAPGTVAERAREEYRAALTLVRNRDFDAALSALTEFLSKYPEQEFTDRAMFWRAEAFYAKRDYERALAEFEALSARFPRSEKAADAILKIGMCHQRLGDEQRAQGFFQRVVEQFPESAAARAASKEGA